MKSRGQGITRTLFERANEDKVTNRFFSFLFHHRFFFLPYSPQPDWLVMYSWSRVLQFYSLIFLRFLQIRKLIDFRINFRNDCLVRTARHVN